jgi:long-chain acyl-CoA synthetase
VIDKNQSAMTAAQARAIYESRPWLKLYPDNVPADILPPYTNALEMLLATVQTSPEQPALLYFDAPMSYRELDRQSTALAAALQRHGIVKGDRIALYLQNIPQFLIAMYGIWKVGASVVLCNPMFKQHELEYHLNDSGSKGLICLESLYEAVAQYAVKHTNVQIVITTNELDYISEGTIPALLASSSKQRFAATLDMVELLHQFDGERIEGAPLAASDVAFLTYTSGTTGKPKGAMNTHANVVFNATVYQIWAQLDQNDVVVGAAPFFHITGLIGHLAVAALVGIPVIMFFRFDPAELLRLTEKWRGSFTVAAITAFIALLNHPDIKTRDISSLKKVYSGGAPVAPSIVESYRQATGTYIHNIYGMTETTSPSHGVPWGKQAPVDKDSGALSVGIPVPNTYCRIIDVNTGQDLPPGEVGELLTKGPQIIAGYWEKPEETAHAIRDGYMYTGDVARMDEEGWFYLVDRKKDMIIASGYKVWPREVEDVLYQHPAVREAGVVGAPDAYRGETVVAYVALKNGYETVSPQTLIDFCKQRMANYKYPRRIEIMEELPKTATGKFMRRALRERSRQ